MQFININTINIIRNYLSCILFAFCHYLFLENIHYERGLVNHALSAAMRTFLKDYFVLVSQLENQHLQHNLTLQKLWFYIQSSMNTMEIIANIASKLIKV